MDEHLLDMRIADQIEEIDYANGWTETAQNKFEEYLRVCKRKSKMHTMASKYFHKWYRITTYPILILSGTNAVVASLNAAGGQDGSRSLTIAVLSGAQATLHALATFVEYGKRSSDHNLAANNYAALARSMEAQLWLKPEERDSPKFNFEVVSRDFSAINAAEPHIPDSIEFCKEIMDLMDFDDII